MKKECTEAFHQTQQCGEGVQCRVMWYLVITSLIWSFSFGVINANLTGLDPFLVSWIRLTLSFLVFAPFIKRAPLHRVFWLMLIGAVQFGLMYCLYIYSYQYLAGHEVALWTITTPLFMVFLAGMLDRSWRLSWWFSAVLAVIAALLLRMNGADFQASLMGVLLVQGANLCFAAGQLLYKRLAFDKGFHHFAWLYLGALLVPAIAMAFSGFSVSMPQGSAQWLSLLYVGLIPSGLGFFLWNTGVSKVSSGTAAVMNNLKIPLGVFVAFAVFGEAIHWPGFVGSAILLAVAVWLTGFDGIGKNKPVKSA